MCASEPTFNSQPLKFQISNLINNLKVVKEHIHDSDGENLIDGQINHLYILLNEVPKLKCNLLEYRIYGYQTGYRNGVHDYINTHV